jgi:hypothetical protein
MTKRYVMTIFVFAFVLFLSSSAAAYAEYRGTDLWSNITPVSDVGGLIDRYPISNYQLDYHVSVGVTHMEDAFAASMQAVGSVAFLALAWLVRMIVMAFDWAVNIDVVTGPHGLLEPIGASGQRFYSIVIVPLLEVALVILGCWAGWKTFVSRESSSTFSALARAFCMTVVAMAIVYQPGPTVGRASDMTTELARQIASTGGDVSNNIFRTFVYRPWVLLQFGSLDKVCTASKTDQDGFPFAVSYGRDGARACHSVQHQDADGHGGYVEHFLAYPHGSPDRDAAYDSLDHGTQPDNTDWKVDRTDAPAVDMMQAGGTVQRMVGLLIMVVGIACAILLLGRIALALIFAQVVLLLLLGMAPVVVIASILPWTQGIFAVWGKLILQLLIGKSVFIAMLVLIVAVSNALTSVESTWGYLFVFMLQSAAFAGALYLHKHVSKSALGVAHKAHDQSHHAAAAFVGGSAMTAVAAAAAPKDFIHRVWRSGAPDEHHQNGTAPPREHAQEPKADAVSTTRPDSSSPPASAGRDYSPPGPVPVANGHATDQSGTSSKIATYTNAHDGEEPKMPSRSFREDLANARASQYDEEYREERGEPRLPPDPPPAAHAPEPTIGGLASASSFADDLRRARERVPDPAPAGQERDPRDAA